MASAAASSPYLLRVQQYKDAMQDLSDIADTLLHESFVRENGTMPVNPSKWVASLHLGELAHREKFARETLLSLAPFAYRSSSFETWHILLCRDGLLQEVRLYEAEISKDESGYILIGLAKSSRVKYPLSETEATSLDGDIVQILARDMNEDD